MDLAALSRLGDVVLWDCASNKLHHIHQQYNTPKVIHFLSLHRPAISQDSSICILNNYGQTSRVLPSPTEHMLVSCATVSDVLFYYLFSFIVFDFSWLTW